MPPGTLPEILRRPVERTPHVRDCTTDRPHR
ncbi:hypothetical protein A2U01_0109441, partial [Trifolium medium]|nr:hypothetical protein [Trifolium medium]